MVQFKVESILKECFLWLSQLSTYRHTVQCSTSKEPEAMKKWDDKALRAASELYLSLSDDQKTHVEDLIGNPVKIWAKLESLHVQKEARHAIRCLGEFFAIHMAENEPLSSLMTRIDVAMQKI